jgi:hypothetical protein
MKATLRRFVALGTGLATLQLAVATTYGAERGALTHPRAASAAPTLVVAKTGFSPQDLARYQHKSVQTSRAAAQQTAGASDAKVIWIVVGVAAVVGVVALASGGGGGGGGGGY